MPAAISLTESDLLTALGTFLVGILPLGVPVTVGQVNRVPEPSAVDYVVMTPILRTRLSTNIAVTQDNYPAAPGTRASMQPTQVTIQLDVHGPGGSDNAQTIATLLRDDYACQALAASNASIQPLYAEDPRQMPFLNGENQFEDRWTVDAVLQANITVTVGQDFAAVVTIGLINVDETFPPT